MTPREVVARALWEADGRGSWADAGPEARADYLHLADHVLAALAADPDTIQRAARVLSLAGSANYIDFRDLARAALAAALTPPQEDS